MAIVRAASAGSPAPLLGSAGLSAVAPGRSSGSPMSWRSSWWRLAAPPELALRWTSPPSATVARRRDEVVEDQQLDQRERLGAVEIGADRELAETLGAQVAREVQAVPDHLLDLLGALRLEPPGMRSRRSPSRCSSVIGFSRLAVEDRRRSLGAARRRAGRARVEVSRRRCLPWAGTRRRCRRGARWGRMKASESGSRRSSSSSTWSVV